MASQTLIFDEDGNRFESFSSCHPEFWVTVGMSMCSFKDGLLWTHDDDEHYNNFFGVQYDSSITSVFNKGEDITKTFMVMEQLASREWGCPEITTSSDSFSGTKQVSNLVESDFENIEGKYSTAFLCDQNSDGGIVDGDSLKGNICTIKLRAKMPMPPNNKLVSLSMITVMSKESHLNIR